MSDKKDDNRSKAVGKALKIIRINNDITAQAMAKALNITPSYLSAIENGSRSAPKDFYEKITDAYTLTPAEKNSLMNAICNATEKVQINVKNMNQSNKDLLFALARNELDTETVEKLCAVIRKEK